MPSFNFIFSGLVESDESIRQAMQVEGDKKQQIHVCPTNMLSCPLLLGQDQLVMLLDEDGPPVIAFPHFNPFSSCIISKKGKKSIAFPKKDKTDSASQKISEK